MAYLAELTKRLLAGMSAVDSLRRQRHASFLTRLQNADGGFSGRQGPSDPYYTSFALRGLALAGGLTEAVAYRAAGYFAQQLARPLGLVEQASVVFGAMLLETMCGAKVFRSAADGRDWLRKTLEGYRCADGGYAKAPGGAASSTYCTFLAVVSMELMGLTVPGPERIAASLRLRQREDGGFVELDAMRYGGTNPTAAAVVVLRALEALDAAIAQRAGRFLVAMQNAEGGFRAHGRIPMADLLSTFTALAALSDLGALDQVDAQAARRYLARCENPKGGFGASGGDPVPDAEYTFYGLAAEAILSALGR